jgi:hypothetical protein
MIAAPLDPFSSRVVNDWTARRRLRGSSDFGPAWPGFGNRSRTPAGGSDR